MPSMPERGQAQQAAQHPAVGPSRRPPLNSRAIGADRRPWAAHQLAPGCGLRVGNSAVPPSTSWRPAAAEPHGWRRPVAPPRLPMRASLPRSGGAAGLAISPPAASASTRRFATSSAATANRAGSGRGRPQCRLVRMHHRRPSADGLACPGGVGRRVIRACSRAPVRKPRRAGLGHGGGAAPGSTAHRSSKTEPWAHRFGRRGAAAGARRLDGRSWIHDCVRDQDGASRRARWGARVHADAASVLGAVTVLLGLVAVAGARGRTGPHRRWALGQASAAGGRVVRQGGGDPGPVRWPGCWRCVRVRRGALIRRAATSADRVRRPSCSSAARR